MQKEKRWRPHRRKARRIALRRPATRERGARGARDCLQRRARPIDDDDRREISDRSPMTPEMELAKVVGAHDPDEMDAGARRLTSSVS